jgi:peptidoglycan/xylan/chitin deacetylase (PgdA/CDA1 family)
MISLRSELAAVRRRTLCALYQRNVPLGDQGPIVSFTFDDFPRTAFSTGGAILEQFGARGTYYAALGLMNTSNELGEQVRSMDLDALLEKGHELASHTFGHSSARSLSCPAFRSDVEKGKKAIKKITGVQTDNFAYPFGHVTLRTKAVLGSAVTSARSIFPGFNGPAADLNLLRANSLYGGIGHAAQAEALILQNQKLKSWLIFYTHDVRSSPSPYGCTPALLEAAVSSAVLAGCRILTVREALAEIGVQNGNRIVQNRQCVTA